VRGVKRADKKGRRSLEAIVSEMWCWVCGRFMGLLMSV
jgi:hypothetical protein